MEAAEILNLLMEYYDDYETEYLENNHLTELRKTAEYIAFSRISYEENYKSYKLLMDLLMDKEILL